MAAGGSRHIEVILPGPIPITQASEADTSRPLVVTKPIVKTLGIVTQVNTAQTLPHFKTKTLGITTSANAAQTLTVTKPIRKTLGVTTNVNTAQTLTVTKTIFKTLGVTTVAMSARPITFTKIITAVINMATVVMEAEPLVARSDNPIEKTLITVTTISQSRPAHPAVMGYTRVIVLGK